MDGLSALADPTRRQIVEMLVEGPLPAGAIARQFSISAPAISQHLKTLKAAKLVRVRAEAQKRVYELDREGVDAISDWVEHVRSFWARKLDTLEAELNKEA